MRLAGEQTSPLGYSRTLHTAKQGLWKMASHLPLSLNEYSSHTNPATMTMKLPEYCCPSTAKTSDS
uniref:Uncharacterized protein n=1 Tax=Anguilla anguilla TaxID=7936 RepID=A0A0E9X405_ANGAN